jgi:hypothetical protein
MARKIKAVDADTGKPIEIDADKIKSGPIRNEAFPDDLLRRIEAIHARIRHVYEVNLEQFEIPFMRDSDPVGEVAVWERIVQAFEKARVAMPQVEEKTILHTLLGYSMGALTAKEQADPIVKKIIEIAEEK